MFETCIATFDCSHVNVSLDDFISYFDCFAKLDKLDFAFYSDLKEYLCEVYNKSFFVVCYHLDSYYYVFEVMTDNPRYFFVSSDVSYCVKEFIHFALERSKKVNVGLGLPYEEY